MAILTILNERLRPGMRIVYVLTSLGIGGAERQVLDLAARMERRGHQAALLVLGEQLSEEWPAMVPAERLGLRKRPLSFIYALFGVREFLRGFRPEIVHSHSFHANVFSRLVFSSFAFSRLVKPGLDRPALVCTIHNVYEGGWPRMLAYRLTDRFCERTTAVSQAAAERFVRLRAVPARKCTVVANGIEIDELAPDGERRAETRAAISAGSDFVWLSAGRIAPAKDYPNLLRAFARAYAARSDVRLWIAGEAKRGAAKAGNNCTLRALAAELGIAERVQWLGLRRDLPALLDAADGFVLASAWEGMPLAVAEAMAVKKPVVATDVGGVRELVGQAGSIVPAGDPGALGAAMVAMMDLDGNERLALGGRARERVARRFSMEARAEEWEQLYEDLQRQTEP